MKRSTLAVLAMVLTGLLMIEIPGAFARAGSGGSRGSRSFSAPSKSTPPTPTSPSRSVTQPAPATPIAQPQRPGMFGGLMGGIAGFALGGLLGSMLFGGMGHGFGGGGFGLMDVLLIGGAVVLVVMMLRRRREAQPQPAYAGAGVPTTYYGAGQDAPAGGSTVVEAPAGDTDLQRGLDHIRSMDAAFDPTAVADTARRMFGGLQQAIEARDLAVVRNHATPEMLTVLQTQCDRLRSEKQTNRLERIDVRGADPSEAWQEGGQDFVTVNLTGTLIDFTVDDTTGAVVEGSKTEPQSFDEYWTFTRPVGPNHWKLSAIQTG
ncbi:MAG: Tim44 domain-containing protein [Candidatus Rokubacteria bacterium]|nr:Tim44 domain-containing protein [Candidatus Rokubacteria bacterium]